jgi:hypothetical protein
MSAERLLSIQPGMVKALRIAIRDGVTVDYGVKGTTSERPWAVVAPSNKDSTRGS